MRKFSALDEEVFAAWEELAFRDGGFAAPPMTREEYLEKIRNRMPEWMAILAKAFVNGEWKVGAGVAYMVSKGIWWPAMALAQFDLAEEAIERCLHHPGPFDRFDSADLPIRLHTTRWIRDRSPEAANALNEFVHCGIYRPGVMARSIVHSLCCWIEPYHADEQAKELPITDESRALALTLSVALRAGKRHQREAEGLRTWSEFGRHIAQSLGRPIPEEKAQPTRPTETPSGSSRLLKHACLRLYRFEIN